MLSLSRKKVVLFILTILAFGYGNAQVRTKFQPNYDLKPIRFGYYIGLGTTHYNFKMKPDFLEQSATDPNIIYSITSPNTTVIRAGAMINYFINDYFDIRFSPLNLSIFSRSITYEAPNGTVPKTQNQKAWLEFPLHVKYKSERRNNTRMYVFGGTRFGYETNTFTRKGNKVANSFTTRTGDLMVEYGMGLEFFREYFKVTPELHFSHGIFNMIRKNNSLDYLNEVKSMKTHNVSLLILFQ